MFNALRLGHRIVGIAALVSITLVITACESTDGTVETRSDRYDQGALRHEEIARMDAVERLKAMTLRQRIGQRFIIYVPRGFGRDNRGNVGINESGRARRYLEELKRGAPAGVIVYPWNYGDRMGLQRLTEKLQTLASVNPLGGRFLVAADQEGGRVAAYRFWDLPRFPSAADIGRQAQSGEGIDDSYIRSVAYITGRDLGSVGINMNFAPVLDLVDRPDRSIIGDRSWGNDAESVAAFGIGYVEAMISTGIIPTAKHYPGHGVTRVDSHGRLPIVDMTLEDLRETDLLPFGAAIDAGVPAIMTAHILFPRIDSEYPVTISEVFLHDILREEMGFRGVVVSDGLSMGALADNYEIDEVLERALRLDVDLILLHDRYDLLEIIERVERLIAVGRISESDIDRGTLRVLELKEQYGLLE